MNSLLDNDEEDVAAAPLPAPNLSAPDLPPPPRPRPDHCERIFSDGPGLRGCHNPVAFQEERTNLYFCNECAHELRKRNRDRGRNMTFRALE